MAISNRRESGPVLRSVSPAGRFASASSAFSTRPCNGFFQRSTTPTPLANLYGSPSASSVRFSVDRPLSPSRSISSVPHPVVKKQLQSQKRSCMCSPTTHPGSFRCSLHKNVANNHHHQQQTASYPSNRLNARRSAMTNSLVRIGTVEGDLVRRALAALIRPSSHQQKRRTSFQPRPSRLSVMSKAQGLL